jgi:hypothetical protein
MLRRPTFLALLTLIAGLMAPGARAQDSPAPALSTETFRGLALRGIGPALMSGRIADIAKDPRDQAVWYVAVASGGVWKTENTGTTWTPIFDDESSYSIGTVTVDPENPNVVWVGTGENNSQRSAGYGDGVYKSLDGGQTWTNMGLETSEHIGKIVLDPRDSNVVWVASQGPLWSPGGERGLYKSTDGGETWEVSLEISENTGISDVVLDPRDPDVLYASSYQRRRRQWTVVAGGPESRVYKSTDGGASWRMLGGGLPEGDVGRIGLALSPQNPDTIYATIAAADTTWRSSPIRIASTGSISWTSGSTSPTTAATPSSHSTRATSTSTTTPWCSIPSIRTTCWSVATAGCTRAGTGATPGASSTTCR